MSIISRQGRKKAVSTGAMAGPSTADLFAALRDASAPLSTDDMEAFASGVKLDLAAGGAECRAEVEDLVRASVACSDADRAAEALIVDVRSPGEFARGHVPGAMNVPLFTDDERAKVGTAFAKQGRGVALVLGMKAVRPKLERLVNEVVRLAEAKEAEAKASARAPGRVRALLAGRHAVELVDVAAAARRPARVAGRARGARRLQGVPAVRADSVAHAGVAHALVLLLLHGVLRLDVLQHVRGLLERREAGKRRSAASRGCASSAGARAWGKQPRCSGCAPPASA